MGSRYNPNKGRKVGRTLRMGERGKYKSDVAEDVEIGVLVDVDFMEIAGDDVVVFGHLADLRIGEVSHVPDRTVEGVEIFLQGFYNSVHREALFSLAPNNIEEIFLAGALEYLAHQQHGPELVDRDGVAEVGLLEEFANPGAVDVESEGVDPGDGGDALAEEGELVLGPGIILAGDAAVVGLEAADADEFAAALAEEDLVALLNDVEVELPLALLPATADVAGVEKMVVVLLQVVIHQIFREVPVLDAFLAVFYVVFEDLEGKLLVAVLLEALDVLKLLIFELLVEEFFEAVGALAVGAGVVEYLALGNLLLRLYLYRHLFLLALQFVEDAVDILVIALALVALGIAVADCLLAPAHVGAEVAHFHENLIIVDQYPVDLSDVLWINLRGHQIAPLFVSAQPLERQFFHFILGLGVEGLLVDDKPLGIPPGVFDGGGLLVLGLGLGLGLRLVLVVVEVDFNVLAVDGDHLLPVGEGPFLLFAGVVRVDREVFGLVAVEVDLARCFGIGAYRPDELHVFDCACLLSGLIGYCFQLLILFVRLFFVCWFGGGDWDCIGVLFLS